MEALWGVGPVTAKKLRAIGIGKLVDVRSADEAKLRKAVGSLADWLRRLSHGDDPREVKPDRPWKSISSEDTYPEDLVSLKEMRAEIARLAQRAAASLERKALVARTVTVKLRTSDFRTLTRSRTLTTPSDVGREIYLVARELVAGADLGGLPVRLVGVRTEGLEHAAETIRQPTLEEAVAEPAPDRREAERVTDEVRARFGTAAIRTGVHSSAPDTRSTTTFVPADLS